MEYSVIEQKNKGNVTNNVIQIMSDYKAIEGKVVSVAEVSTLKRERADRGCIVCYTTVEQVVNNLCSNRKIEGSIKRVNKGAGYLFVSRAVDVINNVMQGNIKVENVNELKPYFDIKAPVENGMDLKMLQDKVAELRKEVSKLKAENSTIKEEIRSYKEQGGNIVDKASGLTREISRLKIENNRLKAELKSYKGQEGKLKDYDGELGKFKYDTSEYRVCTNEYNIVILQYIGNKREGIEIPEGIVKCTCMFKDCKQIKVAPKIPESVKDCYMMFKGCEGLEEAPVIPDGVEDCCYMFAGCVNLKAKPEIPASVIRDGCMFEGCKIGKGKATNK